MTEPRIIKRYANRKLYDTQHSCYVTLEQISEMIREGEDVRIIDNNSKEDLTSVTLAQIIFEEEKKQRLLPLAGLRSIIQTSGESIQGFVSQIRGEVDTGMEQVKRVFRRTGDGKVVEVTADGAEKPVDEADLAEATDDVEKASSAAALRKYLESSQRRLDEFQSQLDQQVQKVVGNINPIPRMHKDLQSALERLDAIESRLDKLEAKS